MVSISIVINRNRTSSEHRCYALYFYFLGLSLKRTSQRLSVLSNEIMFLFGIGYKNTNPKNINKKRKIEEFIIEETLI